MDTLISLDLVQLGWVLGLMLIAVGLAIWQQLGIEWNLLMGTGQTIVQLLVAGYFLELVFELQSPWAVLLVLLVLAGVAAGVSRNRISTKLSSLWPWIGGSLAISTAITLAYVIVLVLQPEPWYSPQYWIPLGGILLGNAMNASAIAGERLATTLSRSQIEIETHLSLGATPTQATKTYRQEAIKAGMIPTLNSMMVVGLVTLPEIMMSQVLSGIRPITAASYQILIIVTLAFTNLVATILVIKAIEKQFFNGAMQFHTPS